MDRGGGRSDQPQIMCIIMVDPSLDSSWLARIYCCVSLLSSVYPVRFYPFVSYFFFSSRSLFPSRSRLFPSVFSFFSSVLTLSCESGSIVRHTLSLFPAVPTYPVLPVSHPQLQFVFICQTIRPMLYTHNGAAAGMEGSGRREQETHNRQHANEGRYNEKKHGPKRKV